MCSLALHHTFLFCVSQSHLAAPQGRQRCTRVSLCVRTERGCAENNERTLPENTLPITVKERGRLEPKGAA